MCILSTQSPVPSCPIHEKLFVVLLLALAVIGAKQMLSGRSPLAALTGPVTMVNRFSPGSPLYAQEQHLVDRFNAEPALRERFAGIATRKGMYAEVRTALSRGASSLGEQRLIGLLKAMSAVTPRLPPPSCAKLLLPKDDFNEEPGEDLRHALESLPPVQHKRFTEFYLDALLAEVNDLPIIPVTQEAREHALFELSRNYQGAEATRIAGVLQGPSAASAEDRCWAANTLMLAMSQLAPSNAVAMARIMWAPRG